MFPPQSTPSKRPKRRVESYRIYKRPYSACSQSSRPSPSSYEKATHGRLVGPTLSTPRGDNNYNQYRPLCEVCPRDRDKVVGTLQGYLFSPTHLINSIKYAYSCKILFLQRNHGHNPIIPLQNSMVKKFGSHNMTLLHVHRILCYNEVCYNGTALYVLLKKVIIERELEKMLKLMDAAQMYTL